MRRKTCLSHIVLGPSHLACGTLSLGLEAHRQGGEHFLTPDPPLATVQPLHGALMEPTGGNYSPEYPRPMEGVQDQDSQRPLGRGAKDSPRQTFLCLQTLENSLLSSLSPVPTIPPGDLQTQYWFRVPSVTQRAACGQAPNLPFLQGQMHEILPTFSRCSPLPKQAA